MLVLNLALNMSNVNLSVLEFQMQTQLYSLQGHQPKFLQINPPNLKLTHFSIF
jgi:hypothetical protein